MKKIGILTLRLHTNYGGILQAYALQTILQRMGHEVSVIGISRQRCKLDGFFHSLNIYAKRFVNRYIYGNKKIVVFEEQKRNHEYDFVTVNTQSFVDKYIAIDACNNYNEINKNSFDTIIVGSDQVWRVAYSDDGVNYYLDFAADWNIKRISYAASFGTDELKYSDAETIACRELLAMFDAVSVREDSAIDLCKKHFSVDAKHVLDPTLLLDKSDYAKLVDNSELTCSNGDLLVYILDETSDKQIVIDSVANKLNLKPFKVNSRVESVSAPLRDRIQPPLEQWLRGFMDAEFVIADSFHACVFSIIFNKPFIAYGNKYRGNTRFNSLLRMFGLESQLISSSEDLDIDRCTQIDWCDVNRRLDNLKAFSIQFLKDSLE